MVCPPGLNEGETSFECPLVNSTGGGALETIGAEEPFPEFEFVEIVKGGD